MLGIVKDSWFLCIGKTDAYEFPATIGIQGMLASFYASSF